MNKYRNSACMIMAVVISLLSINHRASGQSALDQLPTNWQSQPIGDFITTMHNAVGEGLSDADRALAASQWMDANDWTTASRKHRVQLVELLDSDLLPSTERFSVRWTGYLVPDQTTEYTLSLWNYYWSPSIITQVWVSGELVLDSSGSGESKAFKSNPIALIQGERVPIRVEFSYDRYRAKAWHARPNAVLSWQTDSQARQVIPSSNLQPPDDFQAGSNGLKGEYFSSETFESPVQTRLDPQLGFLWHYFAVAPAYADRQRQIVGPMVAEIIASLDDPAVVGMAQADAYWCAYALEEVLTTDEATRILTALGGYPALNAARPPRELYLGYSRFRYLPNELAVNLVVQWCKQNPMRESQFGTYPNYSRSEYYGNYDYLWQTANQIFNGREHNHLEDAVMEGDGSCNVTMAQILTFVHKKGVNLRRWREYLESQLEDPGVTGDARASWLMARAFADEVPDSGEPIPLAGRVWMDQALQEASSPDMQRHIIHELVCRLAASDRCDEAAALMDTHASRFEGGEHAADLATWRTKVDAVNQKFIAKHQSTEQIRRDRQINELQRRLDKALGRGDREAIDQLTPQLQKARQAQ